MELTIEKQNSGLVKVFDENFNTQKFVQRDRGFNRQLTTIEETLSRFGLLKNEIKVYLYLARAGEKKAGEIAEAISRSGRGLWSRSTKKRVRTRPAKTKLNDKDDG